VAFTPPTSIGGGGVGGLVTQGTVPWIVEGASGPLATEATLATLAASILELGSEATLERLLAALNDIALTSILQRETMETQ